MSNEDPREQGARAIWISAAGDDPYLARTFADEWDHMGMHQNTKDTYRREYDRQQRQGQQ